jgi:hypothetical protein
MWAPTPNLVDPVGALADPTWMRSPACRSVAGRIGSWSRQFRVLRRSDILQLHASLTVGAEAEAPDKPRLAFRLKWTFE